MKLIEWFPPIWDKPENSLRPVDFVKIHVDEDYKKCISLINKEMCFCDIIDDSTLDDVLITSSDLKAMNVFLPKVKPMDPNSVDIFNEMAIKYLEFESGQTFDVADHFIEHMGIIQKFNARLNCRNVHGFVRLDTEKIFCNSPQYPIQPGLFKGTYGMNSNHFLSYLCYLINNQVRFRA